MTLDEEVSHRPHGAPSAAGGRQEPRFSDHLPADRQGSHLVKLSGGYWDIKVGTPTYADATEVAREHLKVAPERMVWGSDRPRPTERDHKPNDAVLFDLPTECAPDAAMRKRVLVDNPAALYGFSKSS